MHKFDISPELVVCLLHYCWLKSIQPIKLAITSRTLVRDNIKKKLLCLRDKAICLVFLFVKS